MCSCWLKNLLINSLVLSNKSFNLSRLFRWALGSRGGGGHKMSPPLGYAPVFKRYFLKSYQLPLLFELRSTWNWVKLLLPFPRMLWTWSLNLTFLQLNCMSIRKQYYWTFWSKLMFAFEINFNRLYSKQ